MVTAHPLANTALPTISGTPQHGQTLTADDRDLDRVAADRLRVPVAPLRLAGHQLRRTSPARPARRYVVQQRGRDVARSTIRVVVTATNPAGGASGHQRPDRRRSPTPPVNTAPPDDHAAPPQEGQTPDRRTGTWTGTTPMTYTYQWRRCDADGEHCVDIPGATAPTYKLTARRRGRHDPRGP